MIKYLYNVQRMLKTANDNDRAQDVFSTTVVVKLSVNYVKYQLLH